MDMCDSADEIHELFQHSASDYLQEARKMIEIMDQGKEGLGRDMVYSEIIISNILIAC